MQIQLGPSHDSQRFRPHHRMAQAVVGVGVMLLVARLALIQWVHGERYEKFAAIEHVAKVRVQAPRGLIRGADGTVLARNIEAHRLEVLPNRVAADRVAELVNTLRELLQLTNAEMDKLADDLRRPADPRKRRPIVVRRDLVSTHCPYDSSLLELVSPVPYGYCGDCGRTFERVPAKKACPFDAKRLVSVDHGGLHCNNCDRDFSDGDACPYDRHALHLGEHALRCPLCRRTFDDEVAILRANQHRLADTRIVAEVQREYPYRYLASHLLGYMSLVTREEMAPLTPGGPARFSMNDRIGRTGIERALDGLLRGIDGEQVTVGRRGASDVATDIEELIEQLAPRKTTPGFSIRLTVDLELQRIAKVAMKDVYSGAVALIEAKTGRVLVLYSKPSFDPNVLSGRRPPRSIVSLDETLYASHIHRAVHPFPPASTYKVVAAAAGLEEKIITASSRIRCPGFYDYGGRRFHCHDRRGHGELDLHGALRASCNVFFYVLGEQLGIDRLERYSRMMGFGEPTGIEIGENTGRVPSRDFYRDRDDGGYFPGFALSTAAGQKDVTTTPLQLARVYAGIGRSGWLPRISVIDALESEDGQARQPDHGDGRQMGLSKSTLDALARALRAVVNDEGGTGRMARSALTTVAGKTGTAQAAQRPRAEIVERLADDPAGLARISEWLQREHAWFVGYAPADDPQVAVAVFVEHGGSGGQNAGPIARQVVDAWFDRLGPAHELAPVAPRQRSPNLGAHGRQPAAPEEAAPTPVSDSPDFERSQRQRRP